MKYITQRLAELGLERRLERSTQKASRSPAKYPEGTTSKPCTRCGLDKSLDQYDLLEKGALGRNPRCRDCRKETAKLQTKNNRETLAGRPRPGHCECCGEPNRRLRALHYDHCHATNAFRGWICHDCNAALGHVFDSIPRLQKLISYLLKHQR